MDKKTRDNSAMMNGLYWWGVPTLFRCPHNPDTEGCDIALVGVPHSTGTVSYTHLTLPTSDLV